MLGRASYMSRTSAFKIKVAADCSNQRKVGAALATGWIFFSSVPQFKELSFCFLSGIAMGSWYIAWSLIILNNSGFGFWLLPDATLTSSKMAVLICCTGMGKSFGSGWLLQERVLLQDIQPSFFLPKRPGSFRQALAKQSEIWGGLSDMIFFKFVQYGERLYPTLTWTAEEGALTHLWTWAN